MSKIQRKINRITASGVSIIKKKKNSKATEKKKTAAKKDKGIDTDIDTTKLKKVLMIGRPNVGKSTLYNKFLRKKTAITFNTPGITRDILEGVCDFYIHPFIIMDCAGFDSNINASINRVEYAIKEADVVLFVTEYETTADDLLIASWIRKNVTSPIILVINKYDKKVSSEYANPMGFKNYICISAEHNIGIIELCAAIGEVYVEGRKDPVNKDEKSISIAILGRPNVGKSTFANNLLGGERMLVSPIAGTTRDAIAADLKHHKGSFTITDTAGIRRRGNICDVIETESVKQSFTSIDKADVVIFICDIALKILEKQDLLIISKIIEKGRPFLILANKSDTVKDIEDCIDSLKNQCTIYSGQDISILPFSSLKETGHNRIINHCIQLHTLANTRISTSKLNSWLKIVVEKHSHPFVSSGKAMKFKYITQVGTSPLKFILYTNFPKEVKDSYKNYLKNSMSKSFGLSGVPIFLYFKASANPYGKA